MMVREVKVGEKEAGGGAYTVGEWRGGGDTLKEEGERRGGRREDTRRMVCAPQSPLQHPPRPQRALEIPSRAFTSNSRIAAKIRPRFLFVKFIFLRVNG